MRGGRGLPPLFRGGNLWRAFPALAKVTAFLQETPKEQRGLIQMPLKPEQVKSVADAKKIVEERGLTHVKVGVFDGDAILRGKYMSKAKFLSALENGFGFCDVVLGWDSHDQLFDNVKYTGWHTAYPDAPVRGLPDTCRA